MEFAKYKRQINVSEYYKMAEVGILKRGEKLELIQGEIIRKFPNSPRQASFTNRLNARLGKIIANEALLSIKHPLRIDEYNEPEPDIAVLAYREDYYSLSHPKANQVFFIIELAETSLNFDREIKAPLYARAGIPVYWILDLKHENLEVYSNPQDGLYRRNDFKKNSDKVKIPGFDVEILVSDILT